MFIFVFTASSLLHRLPLVEVSRDSSLVEVSRDSSLVVLCRLLIVVPSLVVEHGLWGAWVLVVAAPGF